MLASRYLRCAFGRQLVCRASRLNGGAQSQVAPRSHLSSLPWRFVHPTIPLRSHAPSAPSCIPPLYNGIRLFANSAPAPPTYVTNFDIIQKYRRVSVVSDTGEMLGEMSSEAALEIAEGKGLDLVQVATSSKSPVCKILNFKEFAEARRKQTKAAKTKKSAIPKEKEVRLSTRIGPHDMKVKVNQAIKFLDKGHRVRISVELPRSRYQARGRPHQQVLKEATALVAKVGSPEDEPKLRHHLFSQFFKPTARKSN